MPDTAHPYTPDTSFDGGDLDCGNGLLLLIRKHIDPLEPGQLLEIISYEPSVEVDLPSWSRMTKNDLVNVVKDEAAGRWSFLVSKGPFDGAKQQDTAALAQPVRKKKGRKKVQMEITQPVVEPFIPDSLTAPAPAPRVEALSVIPHGSWPRPKWLLSALHSHLEGRLDDAEFQEVADDAVSLAVAAQERAGVDLVVDGEMRRDNYSSFVAGLLQNTQLIPITDLLPYVDDPETFELELNSLDVPASEVRHPAVFGKLGRDCSLTVHEAAYVQSISDTPVKVCLPGPYLLARTMWMECISDRAYDNREELAVDIVRVLREEIAALLAQGVAMVQLDEPVLTEVLYGDVGGGGRTFMCGALGEREPAGPELAFAQGLLQEVVAGFPAERLALHVCRGNWTPDESAALAGDYAPLVPLFASVGIENLILELCTPRAGELDALRGIRDDQRVGVGIVNQKLTEVDSVDAVLPRINKAVNTFGRERVLLSPDCGFATFADNPITPTSKHAEAWLKVMVAARDQFLGG